MHRLSRSNRTRTPSLRESFSLQRSLPGSSHARGRGHLSCWGALGFAPKLLNVCETSVGLCELAAVEPDGSGIAAWRGGHAPTLGLCC